MVTKVEKEKVLKRLLEAAVETWGEAEIAKIRPAFETIAEAICTVEAASLEPEEEPAHPLTLFRHTWERG